MSRGGGAAAAAERLLTTGHHHHLPIHHHAEPSSCTKDTVHHPGTISIWSSSQQQRLRSSSSRNRTTQQQLSRLLFAPLHHLLLLLLLLFQPRIQPSWAFPFAFFGPTSSYVRSSRSAVIVLPPLRHHHLGGFPRAVVLEHPSKKSRMSTLASSSSSTQEEPTTTTTTASVQTEHNNNNNNNNNKSILNSNSNIPNWRSLPKPNTSRDSTFYCSILQQPHNDDETTIDRPLWSDDAYQDSLQLYDKLTSCSDAYVRNVLQDALTCLDHALRLYGPACTLGSFNGGKDAVVILHLLRAALAQYYRSSTLQQPRWRPRVVYFEHEHEFPDILEFLHESVQQYDLDMLAFAEGTKFQDGLQVLTDCNSVQVATAPNSNNTTSTVRLPMAFVLGTRLTDPNAVGQQPFAPSSHYMPPFMRVNPILHWTYGHVWHVLRLFQLPYCRLYDQGYTSLGTIHDTVPCPALAVPGYSRNNSNNDNTLPKYWPAYMLSDWDQERAGRLMKEQVAANKQKKKLALKRQQQQQEHSDNQSLTTRSETETASIGHLSTMSSARRIPIQTRTGGNNNNDNPDDDDSDFHIPSSVSYTSNDRQKSAALLIIGDEILKGFTADTNTQHAATALRDNNVLLKTVSVVSDDPTEIANEIRRLQKVADVIITSGGVGPTHDDVTLLSVSEALNCEMQLHPEMAQLLRDKMNGTSDKTELTQAQQKMATLPASSKLRYLSDDPNDWPVLQVKNLFILPGVPEYFETKIVSLGAYLGCQLERRSFRKVVLKVDETSIVPVLNQVVEHHPDVVIGSYPFVSHPEFKTVITVEARLVPLDDDLLDDDDKYTTTTTAGRKKNPRNISTVYDRSLLDEKCLHGTASAADTAVQMALDELIHSLPPGSVLRVESDDMTSLFS